MFSYCINNGKFYPSPKFSVEHKFYSINLDLKDLYELKPTAYIEQEIMCKPLRYKESPSIFRNILSRLVSLLIVKKRFL